VVADFFIADALFVDMKRNIKEMSPVIELDVQDVGHEWLEIENLRWILKNILITK